MPFYGSRAQAVAAVYRLVRILTGRESDPGRIAEGLLLRMGLTVLGKIQDAYVVKSEHGIDEMGIQWPELSPVMLALRSRTGDSSARVVTRLKKQMASLSGPRRKLIELHYRRLLELYESPERGEATGSKARRHARFLLQKMRPFIPTARYEKIARELRGPLKRTLAERLATAHAFALILRDTGYMLGTLSPQINSPDRILRIGPGFVTVGSNDRKFPFHQSAKPRKLKKDGTPKLPRRQILPDRTHPMPRAWWRAVGAALASGLASQQLWERLLSQQQRTAAERRRAL